MVETLGKMNKNLALSGSRSRDYFNKNGQLINIKVHFLHFNSSIYIGFT